MRNQTKEQILRNFRNNLNKWLREPEQYRQMIAMAADKLADLYENECKKNKNAVELLKITRSNIPKNSKLRKTIDLYIRHA